jgi:Uma2 family endonuclease
MSIAEFTSILPNAISDRRRLFTAADLAHFPTDLPSGPVDYELDHGVLIMMMRPTRRHSSLQARLAGELHAQGEKLGYGNVYTEVGIVLSRNPDRVVGPDVAFYAKSILPLVETPEGYLETMPSLAVEVRSKNDSRPYIDRKASDYLNAGVPLVWIVDADANQLLIMQSGRPTRILNMQDTLTADGLIPGFQLALADLFRESA